MFPVSFNGGDIFMLSLLLLTNIQTDLFLTTDRTEKTI